MKMELLHKYFFHLANKRLSVIIPRIGADAIIPEILEGIKRSLNQNFVMIAFLTYEMNNIFISSLDTTVLKCVEYETLRKEEPVQNTVADTENQSEFVIWVKHMVNELMLDLYLPLQIVLRDTGVIFDYIMIDFNYVDECSGKIMAKLDEEMKWNEVCDCGMKDCEIKDIMEAAIEIVKLCEKDVIIRHELMSFSTKRIMLKELNAMNDLEIPKLRRLVFSQESSFDLKELFDIVFDLN